MPGRAQEPSGWLVLGILVVVAVVVVAMQHWVVTVAVLGALVLAGLAIWLAGAARPGRGALGRGRARSARS